MVEKDLVLEVSIKIMTTTKNIKVFRVLIVQNIAFFVLDVGLIQPYAVPTQNHFLNDSTFEFIAP